MQHSKLGHFVCMLGCLAAGVAEQCAATHEMSYPLCIISRNPLERLGRGHLETGGEVSYTSTTFRRKIQQNWSGSLHRGA